MVTQPHRTAHLKPPPRKPPMSETTTDLPIADTNTLLREARVCYGSDTYPVRAYYPTAMGTVTALAYRIETRKIGRAHV